MKLNNRRGFTLTEVVVSLAILALIIFTFTPLILASFNSLVQGRELRDGMLSQKTSVETQMANNPEGTKEASVKFTQGAFSENVTVEGTYLEEPGVVDPLTTFVTNKQGEFSITPSVIAHGQCLNIRIFSSRVTFKDASYFSLQFGDPDQEVDSDARPTFTIDPVDPHYATMKISKHKTADFAKSPYKVRYNDGKNNMFAYLTVRPPLLVAAGEGTSWYYKADSAKNGIIVDALDPSNQWVKGEGEIPIGEVYDMVWTGSQLAAAGKTNTGKYLAYTGTGDTAATSGWNAVRTGNTYTKVSIQDLDIGPDGKIYLAGFEEIDYSTANSTRYLLRYAGNTPEEILKKLSSSDFQSFMAEGMFVIGTNSNPFYGWHLSGIASVYGGAWDKVFSSMETSFQRETFIGADWNDSDGDSKSALPSEYLLLTSGGDNGDKVYSYFPNLEVKEKEKRRDDFKRVASEEIYSSTVKATLTVKNDTTGKDMKFEDVTIEDFLDDLVAVPQGTAWRVQHKPTDTYIAKKAGKELVIEIRRNSEDIYKAEEINITGTPSSVVYGNDSWVVSGTNFKQNSIVISKTYDVSTIYSVTLTPPENGAEGSFAEDPEIEESEHQKKYLNQKATNTYSKSSPLIYRPAKASEPCEWEIATLKTASGGASMVTNFNRVAYVGNRYYAGGDGCIYSSKDGKEWVAESCEEANFGGLNIRAIAGSGV